MVLHFGQRLREDCLEWCPKQFGEKCRLGFGSYAMSIYQNINLLEIFSRRTAIVFEENADDGKQIF